MGTRLSAGQKPRTEHCRLRAQSQHGNHAAGVGDAAGGSHDPNGLSHNTSGKSPQRPNRALSKAAKTDRRLARIIPETHSNAQGSPI
jgi:hypothetical protein